MQLRDDMALWMGVLADSLDDIVNVQRLGQMLVHAGGSALVDVLHKCVVINPWQRPRPDSAASWIHPDNGTAPDSAR